MKEKCQLTHSNVSIRKATFQLLDRNHDLSPSNLCTLQGLDPKIHGATLRQYKMQWKREYKNRLGLKSLKFHAARGWVYQLKMVDRTMALERGWKVTRARNKMIVWNQDKRELGRLEWFATGRINIWVRKPATWGKLKQLLSKAFCWNKLIEDPQIFDLWANSARFKGAHLTYDYGEKVPYMKIDFLKDALGVVFKTGDLSDPTCAEIEFVYPDWAERVEKLLEQNRKALDLNSEQFGNFSKFLAELGQPKKLKPDNDYSW